jgi:hypothetical protein
MDNTGRAAVNRILRLPFSQSSQNPKIALDLLWIEGFFKAALLFTLDGEQYRSLTCAGLDLGGNVMIIPRKNIAITEKKPKCIGKAKLLGLSDLKNEDDLWAYALDRGNPRRYVILVIAGPNFNAAALADILEETGDVFTPDGVGQAAPEGEAAIREELSRFALSGKGFQGIVFQAPKAESRNELTSMTVPFAQAVPLSSQNTLILFSDSLDRELIKHRLIHSLRLEALASFEATGPERALSLIQPYI